MTAALALLLLAAGVSDPPPAAAPAAAASATPSAVAPGSAAAAAPVSPPATRSAAAPATPSAVAPGFPSAAAPAVRPGAAPTLAPAPRSVRAGRRAAVGPSALQATAQRLEQALNAGPDNLDTINQLAQVLAQLDRRAEALTLYRRAIALAPDSWLAYARLAELLTQDPRRWEQRGEVGALLKTGLARTLEDAEGHLRLLISTANFERAVGQTQAARARLQGLETAALPAALRKQVLDLLDDIQSDEQQSALRDWPEPPVAAAHKDQLLRAEQSLRDGDAQSALREVEALLRSAASWRAPRWLEARALLALGRFDDAERELTILLQLSPSHAAGWRELGILLAAHGGALDAGRSDEALRHALALEPGYFDLWLLRAQVALRRGELAAAHSALQRYLREALEQAPQKLHDPEVRRLLHAVKGQPDAAQQPARAGRSAAVPSAKAQELYHQAKDWLKSGDPVGLAPDLLAAALQESPGFIDAAVTTYALTGQVPPATVAALWQDGESLLELARQLRALASTAETRQMLRPWLDRAVALGSQAAYFERGALLIDDNKPAEGLADLRAYVAGAASPVALDEARVLLAAVDSPRAEEAVLTRARSLLLAAKPQEALAALGGACRDGEGGGAVSATRLVLLGVVHEWAGELPAAVDCYRLALRRGDTTAATWQRLAGVAARAPLPLTAQLEPELQRAATQGAASAHFALARLALARGQTEPALARIDSFLHTAPLPDPSRSAALLIRGQITAERARLYQKAQVRRLTIGGLFLVGLGGVLTWLLRGRTLARALVRRPALFPEVARTIGQLRHDVLKHRTSALGLLAADPDRVAELHEQVQHMLWEPERASGLIAAAYARLQTAARAHGVLLRPLRREPIFGPLVRDLRRAESLLRAAQLTPAALVRLRRVDERLRELHSERLASLLRLGPRTRVDALLITAWIRDVEAELRLRLKPWISPVLLLEGLDLEFPVERQALMTLFANLLRNAQAAVAEEPAASPPSVLVRVGEERDAMGRRLLLLLVGDSATRELTLETVERRESGRGLAILRDLVHEWRGHLIVRAESPPLTKGVGACFPT